MERTHKTIEIAGISDTSFGEASQNAVVNAGEPARPVDWFTLAEQCVNLSRVLTDRRGKLDGTNL